MPDESWHSWRWEHGSRYRSSFGQCRRCGLLTKRAANRVIWLYQVYGKWVKTRPDCRVVAGEGAG